MKLKYYLIPIVLGLGFIGSCFGINYLDLGSWGYPTYGYQTGDYRIYLDLDGSYGIEKNGETKNLLYGWASVRGRPFLYYFMNYNGRLGLAQFMDNNDSYNISTVNRIWYNATIYNYTTQSGKFINGQSLPTASSCNSTKPDNNTWSCYFKKRDDFGDEYNGNFNGIIWHNNNSSFYPCFVYDSLNEIVCADQRTTDNNNYALYDSQNRYSFSTFNNSMGFYPSFLALGSLGVSFNTGTLTDFLSGYYTVGDVLSAYSECGYVKSLCYGDHALNDVAVSGDISQFYPSFDDGVYYTGATVFDLYNAYSGGNNFDLFMNSWLARWYPSYSNNTSLGFIGYSKGLWYLQYKVYIHRSDICNYTNTHLYNYCTLALNTGLDLNSGFNNSMINGGSLPSGIFEELQDYGDISDSVFPDESSVFYNTGAFIPGGGAGGGGGEALDDCREFDNPISVFRCMYAHISGVQFDAGEERGVLPLVIGLAFLLSLLYYGLKR